MKKIIFSAILLFSMCIGMNAQKIKWDGPSALTWQVKRCYVKNDRCMIDLLTTNEGSQDIRIFLKSRYEEKRQFTVVYDDEGNSYEYWFSSKAQASKRILNSETLFNGQSDRTGPLWYELPAGLTVKAHIVLNDFDEYATKLSLVKLMFGGIPGGNYATLEIRDLPVKRD